MAGNMRDRVVKTSYLRRLDQTSELRRAYDLDQVLAAFCDARIPLLQLARDYGIVVDERSERHVADDWLNEGQHGWFRNPHNNDVLRRALTEAVRKVREADLPIDAYWVCALPAGDPFEIYQAVSERQITLLILTPHPDTENAAVVPDAIESAMTDPRIYVTKWDPDRNAVVHAPVEE